MLGHLLDCKHCDEEADDKGAQRGQA